MLDSFFQSKLDSLENEDRLRRLPANEGEYADFSSNDYLGFARSTDLARVIKDSVESYGVLSNGATGSRLLTGNSALAVKLEKKLAGIFKSEATLLFNSGYVANLAVLSAIPQRGDTVLYDELVHASIKDGLRLSFASRFSFRHNDTDDLTEKIKKASGKIFIFVESIYSMDGDFCALREIVTITKNYNAIIILDEAHSTGALGERGGGLAVLEGLQNEIDIRIYTFGKAMGVHGACVAGSKLLIDYLINSARPFIYTTALPPHSVVSIDCAFEFLRSNSVLQKKLQQNVDLFVSKMTKPTKQKHSAIQTLVIPGNREVRKAAALLQQKGFDVRPILSPTVKQGSERLRICLHAFNTTDEITGLVTILKTFT